MSWSTPRLAVALALMAPIALYAQHAFQSQGSPAAAKTTAPAAQKKTSEPAPARKAGPAKSTMTDAQKIASAESAAPASIARHAAIMDWPDSPGGTPRQLRAGTNGWVCYPTTGNGIGPGDPMCLDKQWQSWGEAYMSKGPVKVTGSGIAYMLKGDKGASNTDPTAMAATPTNNWVVTPAHIMVLYPDTKMLDTFSADPKNGGPFVMWKGTPYAHLMVPVSPAQAASMK